MANNSYPRTEKWRETQLQVNAASPTPLLCDILKMRNQRSNTAYRFIVDNILGCVVGNKRWRTYKYLECVMDKVTVSDEAFAYLVIENNWDFIQCKQHAKPKYTTSGHCASASNDGWTDNGIRRYHQLLELVAANRKEEWARRVDTSVKESLFETEYGSKFPPTIEQAKRMQRSYRRQRKISFDEKPLPEAIMDLYGDMAIIDPNYSHVGMSNSDD